MIHNFMTKAKNRAFIYPGVIFVLLVSVYFYINNLTVNFKHVQEAGEKCQTELTNSKYQLDVVTEYKNRMDSLMLQNQRHIETEKVKLKELMEDCAVIKQQTSLCQGQFEDLQIECKKIRDENEMDKKLETQAPTR